jgi:hypothetical protein
VCVQVGTYSFPKIVLVGGLEHFLFSIIYGIILPIDFHFARWLRPPTRLNRVSERIC